MTNKYSDGGRGYFSKKVRKKRCGFTLIELLAVIIILGILMIIAIPSVTEYIQTSRKSGYVTTATQYISGARSKINSAEIPMHDTDTTYYLPASCISLESGGDSPFGELEEAYIVVTYDGSGYDYYWTSRDSVNMGILLTYELLLNEDSVESGISTISTNIGVGEREKILLISNCNINDAIEIAAIDTTFDGGVLEDTFDSYKAYTMIENEATLDNVASTYVSSSTGINFESSPSDNNGKGIYLRSGTENNKYPIYYYRGAVTNNNVIFANFCWKIVRTTETGGIKLIYNGEVKDGSCNNTGVSSQIGKSAFNSNIDHNAYVGYMYGDVGVESYESAHANINNSTIKTVIDNWYKTNIEDKGYTSKLEDTVWCNDRTLYSGTGIGTSETRYGTHSSLDLKCLNVNDSFTVSSKNGNGKLIYPVALLTIDETTLAGMSSSYLNSGQYWWLLSPFNFTGLAFEYGIDSGLNIAYVGYPGGIRPSVSLMPGTRFVIGGDGTPSNPYVVK